MLRLFLLDESEISPRRTIIISLEYNKNNYPYVPIALLSYYDLLTLVSSYYFINVSPRNTEMMGSKNPDPIIIKCSVNYICPTKN